MTWTSRCVRQVLLFIAVIFLALSCSREKTEPTGGETHFLRFCSSDSCGEGLRCVCGVCTAFCEGENGCWMAASAMCVASSCTDPEVRAYCEVSCQTDDECAVLSAAHHCEGGVCRAAIADCKDDGVSANEVLVLGDSFFARTHQITAYLEDQARNAERLSVGERYRDNSKLTGNALALSGNGILDQYALASADAAVRVVIMNGGGADVLLGSCDEVTPECPLLVDAATAAREVLARMAEDGVEHVVYAFYPDPLDAAVRERMDALRPLIEEACRSSPVPCHWLDLRPTFEGRYGEYVTSDGLNPTALGSEATAGAIWSVMREHCIAQ